MIKERVIEIVRYENRYKNDWDYFVDNAKNGTFLFRREFMEYHKDRFIDFSLMIFLEGKLTAILPANIYENKVVSHQGLTYGGLLVKSDCKFSLFKNIFFKLNNYLLLQGVVKLVIKPLPTIYCETGNDELAYLHQIYGSSAQSIIGSVVNKNNILISKSIIRNAKKAVKKGIEIQKSDDFETFWNELLIPRLQDRFQKKPIHSLNEIKLLKKRFPDKIELVAAFLNNEMIAGTILFSNKNFIKSQYISGKKSYNKLGGLDLLHYEIINNLKYDFFDFGTSSSDTSVLENSSLLEWKEQFGARTLVFPIYTFKITSIL